MLLEEAHQSISSRIREHRTQSDTLTGITQQVLLNVYHTAATTAGQLP